MAKEYIVKVLNYKDVIDGIRVIENDISVPSNYQEVGELVRCKDCKHRPTIDDEHRRNGSDLKFPTHKCPCECYGDRYYSWMPKDDWFCGNGERKEE